MDLRELERKARMYIQLETGEEFRREVEELLEREDWEALNDRFFADLEFGTGGMRGIIGGGFFRMNPLMVRRATQGLANYILSQGVKDPSAAIAYDSRRYSRVFAREAALVLCGNGIKTYLFEDLRPTPELSFTVRHLGTTAGIVITASHNPPQYNGYKVYWSDGGQVVPPHDKGIIEEVRKVISEIRSMPEEEALARGLLTYIGEDVDRAYFDAVRRQVIRPDLFEEHGGEVSVVYTPLHGTGRMPVETVLRGFGIDVFTVPEQADPDGDFPTVEYPNPEEASALELALSYARKRKADVVMATDPDSDRLGIAVPDGHDYVLITGNQLGALLADYIFSSKKEMGSLPERPAFVKSIVTTNLQRKIVESYGVECHEVLTGFKYFAAKIREFEEKGGPQYVFGTEESYGFLVGTDVRDKDAVSASILTVEMTLYHRVQGKTLLQRLEELYRQHGYFEEILTTKTFPGEKGIQVMRGIMERLRTDPPLAFGDLKVVEIRDYLDGTTLYLPLGERKKNIDLPSSNVLQFVLEDGSVVSARPSGTEPKIKFYASCTSPVKDSLEEAKREVKEKLEVVQRQIDGWIPA
ncbi:phosphoglucomutase/phosphomannomutase alpha/beta/alpha domain I [Spirochaeta thermophila DSM 6578]|uniref:Phosphoglucomutase/phosphomannomutase alpha/beta/alpha domain I n=1 Tax=Winmispira thermophila (strain ATCC 700085 / DSM 6578 / Z-1203) TaxID=869211 RepID=G0GEU7_WINT7|nr:phospho-sugar mutase [Spirochaeta thermophila]AEJ61503.1 phosphoglucomutase/phosphomannomutase alpha/beta/alpha domain I [Spirochaeta thermophila DSM 6578]